jgi:hypothetical protein
MDSLAILQRLGSGQFIDNLAEALIATSDEVVKTGKPGTITVTFKVSTRGQGNPFVTIDEAVKRASPKEDPKGALFFALEGGLYREDPRQIPLEFREVDRGTGEIREVATAHIERSTE